MCYYFAAFILDLYNMQMWHTVDREIFAVKKFSPVARVAKIKRAKNYFALYLQYKIRPGGEN